MKQDITLNENISKNIIIEEEIITLLHKITSDFTIKTNEQLYKNGIIENMFCVDATEREGKEEIIDHNWLLACYLCNSFLQKFNESRLLCFNDIHGFIDGVNHFSQKNNLNIEICNIYAKNIKNVYKLGKYDVMFYNDENNHLIAAYIALSLLHDECLFIAKITYPEYWGNSNFNILLLYSLIFDKTELLRFPVCIYGKVYYQYYIIGINRTLSIYDSSLLRKINILIKNKKQFKITTEFPEWRNKINETAKKFINTIGNPLDDIYKIINELKDIL